MKQTRIILGLIIVILGIMGLVGHILPSVVTRQFWPLVMILIGVSLLARHKHTVIGGICTGIGVMSFMSVNHMWNLFHFGGKLGFVVLILFGTALLIRPRRKDEEEE